MSAITLNSSTSPPADRDGAAGSPHTDNQRPPPPCGSVEEMIATAKVVGFPPGLPDGPVKTAYDIERIVYACLGWQR